VPLGLHLPELIIILVVVLIFFGPKRLPEIGGAIGKTITEFRRSTSGHPDDSAPLADSTRTSVPPTSVPTPTAPPPTTAPPMREEASAQAVDHRDAG
jgi:sec-independent protein translocase protein TatA